MQVHTEEASIEFGTLGAGPPVVLLPGRGGAGTEQYDALGCALAAAGFRAVAVNPRGVGLSHGPLADLSLHDLASDLAAVVDKLGAPAHIVGRALGNRVARCFAADYPQSVKSVSLISAGGLIPPLAAAGNHQNAAPPIRLSHWRSAGLAHEHAARSTPLREWWSGGDAPLLIIQGLDDHIAPPENGRRLASEYPTRVRLLEIPAAGHLVLYERPDLVIPAILSFIREIEDRAG